MKQDNRPYEDSLTNEKLFSISKSQFDIVNDAITKAKEVVLGGKDVLNPSFETLKALADGKELSFPDRPKRAPLEINDEEKGSRSKKGHMLKM